MVSNENIEIVNNYTYLGVKFSANGNFTNHNENLTEKTKRSFFAAHRYLDFLKLPIHIINKLFNTLFFPILTYCSEVGESMIKVIIAAGIKTRLGKRIYIFVRCV